MQRLKPPTSFFPQSFEFAELTCYSNGFPTRFISKTEANHLQPKYALANSRCLKPEANLLAAVSLFLFLIALLFDVIWCRPESVTKKGFCFFLCVVTMFEDINIQTDSQITTWRLPTYVSLAMHGPWRPAVMTTRRHVRLKSETRWDRKKVEKFHGLNLSRVKT